MAVLYDNDTQDYVASSGATFTFSHTVGSGTNRLIIVHVACWPVGSEPTGVTYNGTPLALLGAVDNGTNMNGTLWYLKEPTSGAHDVIVTPGSSGTELACSAISYEGVDQTTVVRDYAGAADSSSPYQVADTSLTIGDLRLGCLASYGIVTFGTGTERWNDNRTGDATNSHGEDIVLTGTSQTMSWTSGETESYVAQAISIISAAGDVTEELSAQMPSTTKMASKLWKLQSLQPSVDTDQGDWQPSTGGDLYAMVDENVPNDSDYIYLDT